MYRSNFGYNICNDHIWCLYGSMDNVLRTFNRFMIVAIAMLIGALTSAAWITPLPYCDFISLAAWVLFVYVRHVNR